MESRTQLSVILSNKPGELAKLCDTLKAAEINILAMSIQNVKDAVKELYRIREKTGRRVTLDASYQGILKDSSDYSMIRLMLDKPVEAEKVLIHSKHLSSRIRSCCFGWKIGREYSAGSPSALVRARSTSIISTAQPWRRAGNPSLWFTSQRRIMPVLAIRSTIYE
jgi:acetolactate synthase small subunit